jgi:hypothetical protein
MRKRYIQVDGVLIEVPLSYVPEPQSPLVMPDIKPYLSQIDGREITSRSRHREHLRDNNCFEIGNETKYLKHKPLKSPPGLKEEIIRATNEVFSKRR